MRRISNLTIFFITIILIIGIIGTTTALYLSSKHEEKLIYAMQSKVEYYAKRCYLEKRCENEVTINMLYENGYIEQIYHPVTKELVDPNTKINFDGQKVTINWKK